MRWCNIRAVHHLEVVVTQSGGSLRYQHHVAESDTRHSQIAVAVAQTVTRKCAVNRIDSLTHMRSEC